MNAYIKFLEETISEVQKEEQALITAARKDEANFAKIKINICDVCRTIYNVHAKTKAGAELTSEYVRQLTRLKENWKMSLEKAKEHEDVQKVVIEETKLEMLQQIESKYEELGACE